MNRSWVIGRETLYVGPNAMLRGARVRIEGVIRGSVREGVRRTPEVTSDEELWRRPVAPEDEVRVRCADGLPKVVRAPELACFADLGPPPQQAADILFEESVLEGARFAARAQRRGLDAFVNDAVAQVLRSLGLLQAEGRSSLGSPKAHGGGA